MQPNWFIATPIAPGRWFDRVSAPPSGIRRFHPEDLHATVAFLGAVREEAARAAAEGEIESHERSVADEAFEGGQARADRKRHVETV